ncbi:MAG: pyridoxine 5'-phosphate synthase [Gemmatimonadaceae bacterium]
MTSHLRLYVNVDHVATLREVRLATYPDPVSAALACEEAGADGITAHLREDRRHVQDHDVARLARSVRTVLNLEMACTDEMAGIAERVRPYQVTLVPERRAEITTEGGLDVSRGDGSRKLSAVIERLNEAGLRTSLFIDADVSAVELSRELGAAAVELHTGAYAHAKPPAQDELGRLEAAARRGVEIGLAVHAGHGLNVENVGLVAAIPEIEELNIGHAIVARAVYVGIGRAVREIKEVMEDHRSKVSR